VREKCQSTDSSARKGWGGGDRKRDRRVGMWWPGPHLCWKEKESSGTKSTPNIRITKEEKKGDLRRGRSYNRNANLFASESPPSNSCLGDGVLTLNTKKLIVKNSGGNLCGEGGFLRKAEHGITGKTTRERNKPGKGEIRNCGVEEMINGEKKKESGRRGPRRGRTRPSNRAGTVYRRGFNLKTIKKIEPKLKALW